MLDVSHSQDISSYGDVSDISYPQHDVCFLSQHDGQRQHDRIRHSEGVLQSKTTEESNQTQSEESKNRDVSLTQDVSGLKALNMTS